MPESDIRLPDELDPRGATPRFGLPYPEPTDPVAQGAAAIRALAEAADAKLGPLYSFNAFSMASFWKNGISADAPVPITSEQCDDLACMTVGAPEISPPNGQADAYLVTVNVFFTGGTGDGATFVRLKVGGDIWAASSLGMNGLHSLAVVWMRAPSTSMIITAEAGATGAGHNLTGAVQIVPMAKFQPWSGLLLGRDAPDPDTLPAPIAPPELEPHEE